MSVIPAAASLTPIASLHPGAPARRSMSDVVYGVLAALIASGAIEAGGVVREKSVAERFGIGRMPVAVALNRLVQDGVAHRRPHMHGVVVGTDLRVVARPANLEGIDIELPEEAETSLRVRNWRTLIYPVVEREVASCLLFGRFRIRSQAMAEHFGVSRTVANELLVRLERVGAVRQESNAHWYAGPLTPDRIRDLYEMRILLEPQALRQAAPHLDRAGLVEKLARVAGANSAEARLDVGLLHRLELDLHHDVVLQCSNEELRSTLYRCQLPLITVHLSFGSYGPESDIPAMIGSHRAILQLLIDGDVEGAARELAAHLQYSSDENPERLSRLRALDPSALSPYLDPA